MSITLVGLIMLSRATAVSDDPDRGGDGRHGVVNFPSRGLPHRAYGGGWTATDLRNRSFKLEASLGSSLGPLAGLIIVAHGQASIVWFGGIAALGIYILFRVGGWYKRNLAHYLARARARQLAAANKVSRRKVIISIGILLLLIFSKYFYLVSLSNYYTFYLIHKFHVSVQQSQVCLFIFLFSVAAGTFFGGPLGDRFGRKYIIWFSILGVAPFSLILPHVGLPLTIILTVFIGGDPVLRLSGDRCLRARADSGEGRDDRGAFLRLRLWHRRPRLRGAWANSPISRASTHVFFLCGFLHR